MVTKNFDETIPAGSVAQARELVRKASKITLLTHHNPDGDGISACAALDHILRAKGKTVEAVYPTLPKAEILRQPKKVFINTHEQTPDLIIMCDTANYDRLYYPADFHAIPSINIDHHVSNSITGTINFIDPRATSTCDYLYRILMILDPAYIDAHVADCLMYGLLYDSQVFHTQSTNALVLRIAADLVERGASYFQLVQELECNRKREAVSFWGKVLANVTFNASGTAGWLVVKQKDLKEAGLTVAAIDGLQNFLPQVAGLDVALLFYEDDNGKTKVSFRSKKTDVNAIAGRFGGGGHKYASGLMSDVQIDDLVSEITREL